MTKEKDCDLAVRNVFGNNFQQRLQVHHAKSLRQLHGGVGLGCLTDTELQVRYDALQHLPCGAPLLPEDFVPLTPRLLIPF